MMSEDGESSQSKTTTTAAQKWEDKILYLTFQFNTRIWGFKPFKAALSKTTIRGYNGDSYEVDVAETVCKWNIHKDGNYPVGMSFFQLDNQICMLGGETAYTSGQPLEAMFQMADPSDVFGFIPSKKVYLFDPMNPPSSSSGSLRQHIGLRLFDPMPSPLVAKIEGKIYVLGLYGDHIYPSPGTPFVDGMEHSFRVLEKGSNAWPPTPTSTYHFWRTLPTPPFYTKIPAGMLFEPPICPRKMLAVVGHVLYMYADSHTYSFDTRTKEWHETENDPRLYASPQYATTFSRLITTSSGPSLKKQKRTNISFQQKVENKDHSYSVVVRVELDSWEPEVFVSLVNGEGIRSREQRIDEALPPQCCDIIGVKAIEVPEGDEDEEEDDHLSSTFCVVFPTSRDFLFLSAVRVSLLSPMVVKTSEEDGSRYLASACTDDDRPKADREWLDVFLKVEVVEKRQYAMDAEFGFRAGPFDGLFVTQRTGWSS